MQNSKFQTSTNFSCKSQPNEQNQKLMPNNQQFNKFKSSQSVFQPSTQTSIQQQKVEQNQSKPFQKFQTLIPSAAQNQNNLYNKQNLKMSEPDKANQFSGNQQNNFPFSNQQQKQNSLFQIQNPQEVSNLQKSTQKQEGPQNNTNNFNKVPLNKSFYSGQKQPANTNFQSNKDFKQQLNSDSKPQNSANQNFFIPKNAVIEQGQESARKQNNFQNQNQFLQPFDNNQQSTVSQTTNFQPQQQNQGQRIATQMAIKFQVNSQQVSASNNFFQDQKGLRDQNTNGFDQKLQFAQNQQTQGQSCPVAQFQQQIQQQNNQFQNFQTGPPQNQTSCQPMKFQENNQLNNLGQDQKNQTHQNIKGNPAFVQIGQSVQNQQIQQQQKDGNDVINPQNQTNQNNQQQNNDELLKKSYAQSQIKPKKEVSDGLNSIQYKKSNNQQVSQQQNSNSIEEQDPYDVFQTVDSNCLRCNLLIKEKCISLPCHHNFHHPCIAEHLTDQIKSRHHNQLSCQCGKQISYKTVSQVFGGGTPIQAELDYKIFSILLEQLQKRGILKSFKSLEHYISIVGQYL